MQYTKSLLYHVLENKYNQEQSFGLLNWYVNLGRHVLPSGVEEQL